MNKVEALELELETLKQVVEGQSILLSRLIQERESGTIQKDWDWVSNLVHSVFKEFKSIMKKQPIAPIKPPLEPPTN